MWNFEIWPNLKTKTEGANGCQSVSFEDICKVNESRYTQTNFCISWNLTNY